MDDSPPHIPASNQISELPIFTICQFLDIWSAREWGLSCRTHHECLKRRLDSIGAALRIYDDRPAECIAQLVSLHAIQPTASGITRFLYDSGTRLPGQGTALYLTDPGDRDWESKRARSVKLITEYVSNFDFSGDSPVQALRRVLRFTRLPPSTTATSVFLRKVASCYWESKRRALAERHRESELNDGGTEVGAPGPYDRVERIVMTSTLPHFIQGTTTTTTSSTTTTTHAVDYSYSLNPGYARHLEGGPGMVPRARQWAGEGRGGDAWRPVRHASAPSLASTRSAGLALAVQALAAQPGDTAGRLGSPSDSESDEEEEREEEQDGDGPNQPRSVGEGQGTRGGGACVSTPAASSFVDVSLHSGPWPEGLVQASAAPGAQGAADDEGEGSESEGSREGEGEEGGEGEAGGEGEVATGNVADFTGEQPPCPPSYVHGLDLPSLLDPTSLYVLLYALLILNTDMRSASIPLHRKLSGEAWVGKTRQVAELACLPPSFLHAEYEELAREGLQVSTGSPVGPVYNGPGTYAALAMAQGRGALGALLEGSSSVLAGLQGGIAAVVGGSSAPVAAEVREERVAGGVQAAASEVVDRVTTAAAEVAQSMSRALSVFSVPAVHTAQPVASSSTSPSTPSSSPGPPPPAPPAPPPAPAPGRQGVRVSHLFATLSMR